MTTPVLHPNAELVGIAFIKALLGWTSNVGIKLPGDDSWAELGFVQVRTVGGSSSPYVPIKSPVLGLKCWARNAGNSRQPPWNKAANLAETIRAACFAAYQHPVTVALPAGYPAGAVRTAYFLREPMPLPGDDSAYACYQTDLALHWTTGAPTS